MSFFHQAKLSPVNATEGRPRACTHTCTHVPPLQISISRLRVCEISRRLSRRLPTDKRPSDGPHPVGLDRAAISKITLGPPAGGVAILSDLALSSNTRLAPLPPCTDANLHPVPTTAPIRTLLDQSSRDIRSHWRAECASALGRGRL